MNLRRAINVRVAVVGITMTLVACGEQAQEQTAQNTQPRESFNGYLAYPNDMEEM